MHPTYHVRYGTIYTEYGNTGVFLPENILNFSVVFYCNSTYHTKYFRSHQGVLIGVVDVLVFTLVKRSTAIDSCG